MEIMTEWNGVEAVFVFQQGEGFGGSTASCGTVLRHLSHFAKSEEPRSKDRFVGNDVLAATLRAHQDAVDATKSPQSEGDKCRNPF